MADHTFDFVFVDSQVEEFEKLAFVPRLRLTPAQRGKLLAAGGKALDSVPGWMNPMKWGEAVKGRAIGMLGTSALGAAGGAATADEGQRGAGAIRGALAGAVLGAAGGQLATGQGRRQIQRFGQRQAHSMTGYLPGAYKKEKGILSAFGKGVSPDERIAALRRMKISDIPEESAVKGLREASEAMGRGSILDSAEGRKRMAELGEGWFMGKMPEKLRRAVAGIGLRKDVAKLQSAEKGLTGMPQYLKNLAIDPRATVTTGLLTTGTAGVGLPMALSAPSMVQAVQDRDPEALGSSLAENALYATAGPMPMLGQTVLGGQARRIGGIPGSLYKKLTGNTDQPAEYGPVGTGPRMRGGL